MKTPLSVTQLTTGYSLRNGQKIISDNITASLSEGSFTCLLGPNGAGKSTLFKTLVGFIPPLTGEIDILGGALSDISEQELSKKVSVVLTERPSVASMTARQLVALGRSPYTGFWGRLTDEDAQIVDRSMGLAGCTVLADRLVDSLSDGERQRVMIAKALAQDTPIIFLDEPTAFLDFPSKVDMMRILKRLAVNEGKTILLSSHDVNMALQMADNLWMLDKKLGFCAGSPQELSANGQLAPYFVREGIGYDPKNMEFTVI